MVEPFEPERELVTAVTKFGHKRWKIATASGRTYVTDYLWYSALADRYRELGLPVIIRSTKGFYYRDLWSMETIPTEDAR